MPTLPNVAPIPTKRSIPFLKSFALPLLIASSVIVRDEISKNLKIPKSSGVNH